MCGIRVECRAGIGALSMPAEVRQNVSRNHFRRVGFFFGAGATPKTAFVQALVSCLVFFAASRLTVFVAAALAVPATLLA